MAAEDTDREPFPFGEELVRLAKTDESDPVAELLRANIRRALIGVDEPPRIGRFTALGTVGRGAMGTVLAAYDPVLDRKVALKVVRTSVGASNSELLREARALAKLTHPHVVAVYEAEEIDGRIVIAMQFVHGSDLRKWLRERPRAWSEIVPVFAAIARGLAAAHDAGVVHGDLKPENVLVGLGAALDVRIADFGTARMLADATDGAGGGTPAYMAPERLAGAPASAAADQWAFAVSLHEALFGKRPFAGTTIEELRAAERVAVAPERAVPRRIVAVVERGLARDPAARWPDMQVIAALLERRDVRGRWLLGLAAASSIAVATWFAASRDRDPCAGASDAAWNHDVAGRVRAAFAATGTAHAEGSAERVVEMLEHRRAEWIAARREVCEANRVRTEESDTLHDLRMRCLDRRAAETTALVDALADPENTAALSDAITAVGELPELARCDTASVRDIDYAVPEASDARREVAELRSRIDRAWAQHSLGRYEDVRVHAEDLVAAADRSAFLPVQAEALALLGAAQARVSPPGTAEPTLRRARRVAAEIGNDRLVAEIMVRWLRTVMFADDLPHVDELAEHARAAALRAGTSAAEIDAIVGEARLQAGDADGAIAALEQALAAETRPERRAIVQVGLGSARLAKGEDAEALQLYEEALAGATAHFGSEHPSLGFYLHRVGRGLRAVGRRDEAVAMLERVLALREATLGREDRAIASILADLAATERELGRLDAAAEHQTRAIAIRTAEYGPEHARVADLHAGLGDIERDRKEPGRALAHYRIAERIRTATPGHPQLAALRAKIAALEADRP